MGKRNRIIEVLREDWPLTIAEIAQRSSLTIEQVEHVIDNFEGHGQFQGIMRDDGKLSYKLNEHPY